MQSMIYTSCRVLKDVSKDPKTYLMHDMDLEGLAKTALAFLRMDIKQLDMYYRVTANCEGLGQNFPRFREQMGKLRDDIKVIVEENPRLDQLFERIQGVIGEECIEAMRAWFWDNYKQATVYVFNWGFYIASFVEGTTEEEGDTCDDPCGCLAAYNDAERLTIERYLKNAPDTFMQMYRTWNASDVLSTRRSFNIMCETVLQGYKGDPEMAKRFMFDFYDQLDSLTGKYFQPGVYWSNDWREYERTMAEQIKAKTGVSYHSERLANRPSYDGSLASTGALPEVRVRRVSARKKSKSCVSLMRLG